MGSNQTVVAAYNNIDLYNKYKTTIRFGPQEVEPVWKGINGLLMEAFELEEPPLRTGLDSIPHDLTGGKGSNKTVSAPWEVITDNILPNDQTIYFVQGCESHRIKIGRTKDFAMRLSSLRVSCSERLRVLGVMNDQNPVVEQELHSIFAKHRVRGEWFKPVPAILEFIKQETVESEVL